MAYTTQGIIILNNLVNEGLIIGSEDQMIWQMLHDDLHVVYEFPKFYVVFGILLSTKMTCYAFTILDFHLSHPHYYWVRPSVLIYHLPICNAATMKHIW